MKAYLKERKSLLIPVGIILTAMVGLTLFAILYSPAPASIFTM